MKNAIPFIFVALLMGYAAKEQCYALGQPASIYPKNIRLNEFELLELNSSELRKLNGSFHQKYYIDSSGNVTVKKEIDISRHILEHDNGKFIGRDLGEWGGELTFRNNNEAKAYKQRSKMELNKE